MTTESLLQFPCKFPIKVMGENSPAVRRAVTAAAARHTIGPTGNNATASAPSITERPSRTGKYMAYTITMHFVSQEHLDGMYRELVAIEGVSMVL